MTKRLGAAIVAAAVVIVLATAGREPSPADGHLDAAVASQEAGTPAGQRPNIVFVLTDDLTQNLISDMPHVQALAQAGSTMSQYYVVDSLCCPSRSAIFTGQYPHDNGVYTNKGTDGGYQAFNQHGDPQKSFAVALQKSGYRTALMGKYLNGYFPVYGEPPGWDEWDVGGNAYTNFNYALNENGQKHYYGRADKSYLTDVLSAKAGSFISSAASSGKPFMLEVATFAPHAPYTPAPRYANTASLATYPQTGSYDKLPKNPPSWLKGQPALNAARTQRIAKAYRRRVESVGAVDDMIGHLEDQLRASGAARNTYFVFSSDNGYHMGEYQLMPGKQTAFDTDIHVPLIVSGPGVPGREDHQPAGLQHRPQPHVREAGRAFPARRRGRPQPGGPVARAAPGELAAGDPRRAPRPGQQHRGPGPAGPAERQPAVIRSGAHRDRALCAVRQRGAGVLRHGTRPAGAGQHRLSGRPGRPAEHAHGPSELPRRGVLLGRRAPDGRVHTGRVTSWHGG